MYLLLLIRMIRSVCAGLEELVLSEINSPSRTQQTGDSSSVSSFSYRDMMKEAQPTNQNKVGGAKSTVRFVVLTQGIVPLFPLLEVM